MYTCINTYNVLARVIWPATFARSAGPPAGQNGRTYNIDGGAPVVRLGGLAPARPIRKGLHKDGKRQDKDIQYTAYTVLYWERGL